MALAQGRLLLPLPATEQHYSTLSSSSSLSVPAGSSFTHVVFLLHPPLQTLHRRSFSCASSKLVEVEERQPTTGRRRPATSLKERAPRSHVDKAPWEKANGDKAQSLDNARDVTYRAAPWQQRSTAFRKPRNVQRPTEEEEEDVNVAEDEVLSPMARIVSKLRSIQQPFDQPHKSASQSGRTAGELFLPKPNQDVSTAGRNWSNAGHLVSRQSPLDAKFPWEMEEALEQQKRDEVRKKLKPPTLAELTIPPQKLKQLRETAIQMKQRLKVGRLGITDNIVNSIQDQWRSSELVRLKCEGAAAVNMKKIHQDLERKTGGLVVWRTGSIAVVYRGSDYDTESGVASSLAKKLESLISIKGRAKGHTQDTSNEVNYVEDENIRAPYTEPSPSEQVEMNLETIKHKSFETGEVGAQEEEINSHELEFEPDVDELESHVAQAIRSMNVEPDPYVDREYEKDIDSLLEGLGPRYDSWTGSKPIPVDADLLPPVVSNFKPPYRLLPHGVKPNLSDAELTNLRRVTRPLAPHFVLGRNKGNQGLAVAIVKLWEKSEIAKIAVKKGVQNTNNEMMAEEIKRLTGGVLLCRDKFFITFYRGRDFLPQQVAAALAEREAMVRTLQEEEERAREDRSIMVERESAIQPSVAVISKEAPDVQPSWMHTMDIEEQKRLKKEAIKARRIALARRLERKLSLASKKKEKAEQDLGKIEALLKPIDAPVDTEVISEEERVMFRRLGLKTKGFLLVGRRGVFDGVVENMHLHWKHRELVKVVVKENDPAQLQYTARFLERESGGVLVSVVDTSKGHHAIIVYRGKNYMRPIELRPRNLLTKRKALKRSLEMQRHASLCEHIQSLEAEIDDLRLELDGLSNWQSKGDTDDMELDSLLEDRKQGQAKRASLVRLARLGPIFRSKPVTHVEQLNLEEKAENLERAYYFHVGNINGLAGFARAIRVYFLNRALVKIGVKGGHHSGSLQEFATKLKDLTGGAIVSLQASEIVLYRGWAEGHDMPSNESFDEFSTKQHAAMESEDNQEDFAQSDFYVDSDGDILSDVEDTYLISGMLSEEDTTDTDSETEDEGLLLALQSEDEEEEEGEDFMNEEAKVKSRVTLSDSDGEGASFIRELLSDDDLESKLEEGVEV